MIQKTIICLIICISSYSNILLGQGCSDAGFCTMGAMRPDQAYSKKINFKLRSISIEQYRGKSTVSAVINATTLDFNFGIDSKTTFQFKLPYMYVNGNFGSTSGLGDISLSLTRTLWSTDKYTISGTLGAKIPTNDSDIDTQSDLNPNDGFEPQTARDFPGYYQTSLGSYDIVAGASYLSRDWLFAIGYQQALTRNETDFRWSEWFFPVYPFDDEYVQRHSQSVNLLRGTDLMFRAERNWRFSNYNFNLGALFINRITRDEITSPMTGERVKVENTTGPAISLLAGAGYDFNVNSSLKFVYGQKIIDRDENPDGLTRDNVLSLTYLFRF